MLTRLIALALLACGTVVVAPAAPALAACQTAQARSLEKQTMAADAIFTGTVTGQEPDGDTRLITVAVERVYKGDVPAEATVTTPRRSADCGLRLEADDYVFFATDDGGDLTADALEGTAPATDGRVARVEELLGDGRPAQSPEPAEATFTLVAGDQASLDRLAAPGAALILVGLLGLVLVAALGRRKA